MLTAIPMLLAGGRRRVAAPYLVLVSPGHYGIESAVSGYPDAYLGRPATNSYAVDNTASTDATGLVLSFASGHGFIDDSQLPANALVIGSNVLVDSSSGAFLVNA